ncbi:MAG TPA: tRNA (N(6)-L-threonylcarbamoyladenosine(37)-C(2))-methylthiotransferase MtaB [Chitinophagales bacterium]|nr:tRNA (N(6)-L-threonylcarbamoyladenosine(37)-C(2))-methylthiotransferase MtaB [Chitinophagales bacterium]
MITEKTIAFHTLGCKLNFAESSSISRMLEAEGFRKVKFEDAADVYVINTCSVTENADKECRSIIRKALRFSPIAQVVVVGCYAQLKPEEIASIEGVDLVLGAKEKFRIADHLKTLPQKKLLSEKATVYSCDVSEVNFFESSYSFGERTRAFLKVQDGCDYNCTYCTIPLARGRSRSDTIAHVVEQANLLSESGIKEIVLTGVNIGDFGLSRESRDRQNGNRDETFFDLIQALDEVEGIERFRISSIEPNLLRDEIIEFVAQSKRFMPHFHIPLQSGSDKILKLMKRRYLSKLYTDRVEKIKSVMPHCCIGADVIAGFPGEDEKEFLETYNFLNELDISYLHVFTYSERDSTEAIHLGNVVQKEIRHERNKMLRILSEKKQRAFYELHLGTIRKVLFELPNKDGMQEGLSDNYIKVEISTQKHLRGKIKQVLLRQLNGDFILGELHRTKELSLSHVAAVF